MMQPMTSKRGFTLIELIVVVIILSILVSLAMPQYTMTVERSRSAEARRVLGTIREAELAYYLEYEAYSASFTNLRLGGIPSACNTSFYFSYSAGATSTGTRCTAGGKAPNSGTAYTISLTTAGVLSGTAGYL
jgi:type IV pilus assembly protein PilE